MGNPLIDLVGPHGYTHGWVYHGTGRPGSKVSSATHTRRMSASIAKRSGASTRVGSRLTMSEAANRASQKLSGRRASDFQHLAAARLHSAAARQAALSDAAKAHHTRMAAMHRGIAGRNVGKQTASERSAARERSNVFKSGAYGGHAARQDVPTLQKLARSSDPKMAEAARKELAIRAGKKAPPGPAALRAGETRAPSSGKAQGPNVGELGKAATGSHRLPKGSAALTREGRAKAYSHGHALPPPPGGGPHGFPVTSAKSWEDARKAVGRAGSPARREMLKQLLRRTAAQYGKTAALKKSWAASNVYAALEFAVAMQTFPITGPLDLIISRDPEDGSAVVRHRRGGGEIGRIRHDDDGSWRMSREGKDGEGHTRQRGALLELIGAHNHAAPSPYRRQPAPAAEPAVPQVAQQTDLMRAYGIPAINANLSNTDLAAATPVTGASDGPRVTTGLGPKGQTIYGKLRKRGFPHARAHNFARHAERKAAG